MTFQPNANLSIDVGSHGQAVLVRLAGSADMDQADALRGALRRVAQGEPNLLVLDLSGLTFICSMALGAMVEAHVSSRHHHGQVRLVNPPPEILKVLVTTRLNSLMPVYPSVEEAVGV